MQYICSEKPMRCLDKVTALHPLTHRIVFVTAPHCLCSRTALRFFVHRSSSCLPVMLNLFQHLSAVMF
jgi:hypothetical protein